MTNSLETFLLDHGVHKDEVPLLAQFLHVVHDALRAAEGMLASEKHWHEYRLLSGAFRKPKRGKKGQPPPPRLPHEEGITDALGQCLTYIRKSAPAGHPLRNLEIQFSMEGKLPSPFVIGKMARRTDIKAESLLTVDAPSIVFESKVIDCDNDICKHYLGEGGLGCYTGPDQPYTLGPIGGLIAYTVKDAASDWRKRIERSMAGPPSLAISQNSVFIGSAAEEMLWSTVDRSKAFIKKPIAMAHLVMKFYSEPGLTGRPTPLTRHNPRNLIERSSVDGLATGVDRRLGG